MTGLAFPDVSPVMFSIGGFAVRWYSMAYLAGIVLAWAWLLRDVKKYRLDFDKSAIEDVVFYVTIGIIAGGRLGYALFYGGSAFWREPGRFWPSGTAACLFTAARSGQFSVSGMPRINISLIFGS